MQRLFLRFSQASPKTHVQYGGTGLGLFISRELTELQGGRIGVKSVLGQGSSFIFYVKCRRAASVKEAAETNAEKLERIKLDAQRRKDESPESKAVATLLDSSYINPLNRNNSDHQSPIVGSASDSDTLHVLVVEGMHGLILKSKLTLTTGISDNLINQQVRDRLSFPSGAH